MLRVFKTYVKVSLGTLAAYRKDVVFRLIGLLPVFFVMLSLFMLPFQYMNDLAGWSASEILIVLGMYYIAEGVAWSTFKSGIFNMEKLVGTGMMDGILIKPISPIFVISSIDIDVTRLADVVIGTGLIVGVIIRYGVDMQLLNVAAAVVSLIAGLAISFSIYLAANTFSFWTTEAYLGHLINPAFTAARYPADVWGQRLSKLLYWVIPMGLVAAVPAGVLVGKFGAEWVIGSVAVAVVWVLAVRLFWKAGLRNYAGVGG